MSDIKDLLLQLTKSDDAVYSLVGKVKSIDEAARTCEVIPVQNEEDTIFDVRLQGSSELSEGLVVFPKVDSLVVVTFLNKATGYVALTSEVDKVEIVIADNVLTYDDKGVLIDAKTEVKKEQSSIEVAGPGVTIKNGLNVIEVTASSISIASGINAVELDATGIKVGGAATLGVVLDTLFTSLSSLVVLNSVTAVPSVPNPAFISAISALQALSKTFLK